jgi:hypothetical protein
MQFPRFVVRFANAATNLALLAGIPRPPYTRNNALIVETIGHLSRKRRRVPVGYLDDGGRIIVVVELAPVATGSATRSPTRVISGYIFAGNGGQRVCALSTLIRKATFAA